MEQELFEKIAKKMKKAPIGASWNVGHVHYTGKTFKLEFDGYEVSLWKDVTERRFRSNIENYNLTIRGTGQSEYSGFSEDHSGDDVMQLYMDINVKYGDHMNKVREKERKQEEKRREEHEVKKINFVSDLMDTLGDKEGD